MGGGRPMDGALSTMAAEPGAAQSQRPSSSKSVTTTDFPFVTRMGVNVHARLLPANNYDGLGSLAIADGVNPFTISQIPSSNSHKAIGSAAIPINTDARSRRPNSTAV